MEINHGGGEERSGEEKEGEYNHSIGCRYRAEGQMTVGTMDTVSQQWFESGAGQGHEWQHQFITLLPVERQLSDFFALALTLGFQLLRFCCRVVHQGEIGVGKHGFDIPNTMVVPSGGRPRQKFPAWIIHED